ncbi:hypothetical protein AeNC1_008808 [Aphanomyces euteiches]|nr:hypothetical protein AeNC1_008808 [Aphanomyces euteiches]
MKCNGYSQTTMLEALDDVLNNNLSIYAAANKHGVPESSLRDRAFKARNDIPHLPPGPPPHTPKSFEDDLTDWAGGMQTHEHPPTHQILLKKHSSVVILPLYHGPR